ncbi:hypothetical protein VB715_21015 [Crocosphaera sp. UHCC 0190]|uniref:hypothetical protein n=1 Tax=Crocosphaera sp. UHCC 0190 TaxID=3110246 RepID=UPI002B20432B|nr:hypothetical protein [Crocosphaera sp. UHCC 0190]MEA5512256.1 hypothetical protein [Crocosphaera sp. UHCC 0190]
MVDFSKIKTTKEKAKTYAFEAENFPFITLQENLTETWNTLGLNDLQVIEQEGLINLLTASGMVESSHFDPNNVLLVKASGGVPTGVYGPCIFRDGNMIILRVGDNQAQVVQESDRLIIGDLRGKITVAAAKDASGKEYPTAQVNFVSGDKEIFKVRISLDSQNDELSVGELEATLINEEPIINYLGFVPGKVMKMHELGIGEFEVKAISSTKTQYGESFKLHLADGKVVWARGNSELLLKAGYEMKLDVPLTLVISEIEEYGDGKFKVTNALRERLPQFIEVNPVIRTLEAQVSSVIDDESEPETETETEEQADSIPF